MPRCFCLLRAGTGAAHLVSVLLEVLSASHTEAAASVGPPASQVCLNILANFLVSKNPDAGCICPAQVTDVAVAAAQLSLAPAPEWLAACRTRVWGSSSATTDAAGQPQQQGQRHSLPEWRVRALKKALKQLSERAVLY